MSKAQLDYYQILGVPKTASKIQICKAYKQLALKYHPGLKHDNENESYKKFCLISEAFDILYSDQKRKIYDQYGQQKLKQGIVNQKGERQLGQYTLTTEPETIFQRFFGSKNVYEHLLTVGKGEGRSHPVFSSQYASQKILNEGQTPELVVEVPCGLSQLFNGCKKTLTYDKKILTPDGQSTQTVKQTKVVQIEAGRSGKNSIVFVGQGHQEPGQHPSNLVFKIIQKNEMGFRRSPENPDNLIYTAEISLMDALDSKSISIKQLSGQIIQLHFDEIISPQLMRTIEGKGMPKQSGGGRGALFVKFNIRFPEQIDIEKKARIVQLLEKAY